MIIGCSGHRPDRLGGHSHDAYRVLFALALDYLQEKCPVGVVSGMALGWDQAFAAAAWNLGIPFAAALPFEGQELHWPSLNQTQYKILLNKATVVHVVSAGPYAKWKLQKRNEFVVDESDRIAAMWDGSPSGTKNCLGYAFRAGKPVDNLYGLWKRLQAGGGT